MAFFVSDFDELRAEMAVEGSGRFAASKVLRAVSSSSEEGSSKPFRRAAVWSSSEAEAEASASDGEGSKVISSAAVDADSAGGIPASACASWIVDLTVEDFEVRGFFEVAGSEDVAAWCQCMLGFTF